MMKKVFFIDFDSTITKVDTCAAMVEAFARDGWEQINKLWEEKKLSTEDCANMTFDLFEADIEDIRKLLLTIDIDEHFKEFLELCKEKDYKVYILSDGYDFCIKTILDRYNIDVPYYSNKLLYNGNFKIECVYKNSSCGNCGTCKTSLMDKLKEPGDQVVYIGDGYSDTCAAKNAHIVFAKGSLLKYCMEKGINAIPYNNFSDIIYNFLL